MKAIYWHMNDGKEIIFKVNWVEYFIMKRILSKRKFKIIKNKIGGEKLDLCIIDEFAKLK